MHAISQWARTLLAGVCLAAASVAIAPLAEAVQGDQKPSATDRAASLERWRSMEPSERAELKRRFDKLKELSPEKREEMRARAKSLRAEMRAIEASLDPEQRKAFDAFPPKQRDAMLRSMVHDRAKLAASRLLERMSQGEREQMDAASPTEKEALLDTVRKREIDRQPSRIDELAREMGVTKAERRRLKNGTDEERRAAITALIRARAERHVADYGLPKGLSKRRWEFVVSRPDTPFLHALTRLRARFPELGVPPERWKKQLRKRDGLYRRLQQLATPLADERTRRPRASEAKLRHDTVLMRRPRVEDVLIRCARADEDAAAGLRKLDDETFLRVYRAVSRQLRAGREPSLTPPPPR